MKRFRANRNVGRQAIVIGLPTDFLRILMIAALVAIMTYLIVSSFNTFFGIASALLFFFTTYLVLRAVFKKCGSNPSIYFAHKKQVKKIEYLDPNIFKKL